VDLLLIGGGHAMLSVLASAPTWNRPDVRITLVDASRCLYYSGMVPEYLGGVYNRDEVRIDLKSLCDYAGIDFVQSRVDALDPSTRTATLASGDVRSYDLLAVDVGGVNPFRPSGDVIPTKPIYHVEDLEQTLRSTLATTGSNLDLTIVGGGAAGVEIALNVTGRFRKAGRAHDLSLSVVEGGPSLLPRFPSGLQSRVRRLLTRRGASVRTERRVTGVAPDAVTLDSDERLSSDAVVWATGSVGPDLLRHSGLPTSPDGFIRVTPALHSPADPRVFAAGDCASVLGHTGLGRIGVHAIKQGITLEHNLRVAVDALRTNPEAYPQTARDAFEAFRPYPIAPLILSTGTPDGLWTAGNVWWSGSLALRLKHWIDRDWIRHYHSGWASVPRRHFPDLASAGASS